MDLSTAYQSFWADAAGSFSLLVVALLGLAVVVWDAYRPRDRAIPWVTAVALAICFVWDLTGLTAESGTAFSGMIQTGGFAAFVRAVILLGTLLSVIVCSPYLDRMRRNYGEVYALILFATAGMLVLGTATNLVAVFVGLETMSICLYILAGLVREDEGAIEAALKYFVLGAFSTGFFLYGMALMYGATGTMSLAAIGAAVPEGGSTLYWAGVGLLLIGFLFKVSAVPFHMWTPDVYQGAPTPLTGYMSTASKTAAFASLILVLHSALPAERWMQAVAAVAAITMVLGNLLALTQDNVKRMLAYSSIAHAGYVLTGLAAGSGAGYAGALYYLLVYTVMNVGAFGVLALLEWDGVSGRKQTLDSLSGVGYRKPVLGVAMGFFMFSLTGFPPLGGFLGKYAVFAPAVESGLTWLVIVGVLSSAVSAYYYLRVLYVFWMEPADSGKLPAYEPVMGPTPGSSLAVMVGCAVLLLVLGLYPGLLQVAADYFADGAMALAR